jgi:hypothetical protein
MVCRNISKVLMFFFGKVLGLKVFLHDVFDIRMIVVECVETD